MKKQVIGLITLLSIFGVMLGIIIANGKYIFRSEPYISQTEVNELVDKTYDKAVEENSDSKLLDKVSSLELENAELNNKIVILNAENQKLSNTISEKETAIEELNVQINALNLQIAELEQNKADNEEKISLLKLQVETLTTEKTDLDTQVKLLEYQITQNNETITEHKKTIAQLQNSIKTYEDYIAGLETESEVFAIFVVENEIFEIYKSTTNGLAYLENEPETAENCTFNGWKVNGELVDLSTYKLTCNTTFEADLTYGYTVTFMVENEAGEYEVYNTQTVSETETVTLPSEPSRDNYEFLGWSLDKVNIVENVETSIVSNKVYYSLFNRLYTVNFMVSDMVLDSQVVCNGVVTAPYVPYILDKTYLFYGWSLDGETVVDDINTYAIQEDCTFTALFEDITAVSGYFRCSNKEIGYGVVSQHRTVIVLEDYNVIRSGTATIRNSSGGYWTANLLYTKVVGNYFDISDCIIDCVPDVFYYTDSHNYSKVDVPYGFDFNSGTFYYYLNIGNGTSNIFKNVSIVNTVAFVQPAKPDGYTWNKTGISPTFGDIEVSSYGSSLLYSYVSEDNSNEVSSMNKCITTFSASAVYGDGTWSLTLPEADNVIGWAIFTEKPYYFSYKNCPEGTLSTSLKYLGDAGETIDFSNYLKYTYIYIFAVYSS